MPADVDSRRAMQLLRFYVGTTCYSMEAPAVHAIRRWEESRPAAEKRAGVIASIAVSGGMAPVYSLRGILGLDDVSRPAGPVLVVRTSAHAYGVQVDRVARAVSVPAAEPKQLPIAARDPKNRIRGVVRLEDELSLVLSHGKLAPRPDGAESEAEPPFGAAPEWMASPPPSAGCKLLCLSELSGFASTTFGFALRQMIEVTSGLRIVRLGTYNPCVYGLAEWRGYIVPVIVPGSLTCLPCGAVDFNQTNFAILRGSRSRELFALPAQNFAALTLPFPNGAGIGKRLTGLGPYVRAAYEMAGGCLVLPDLDRLVMV